MYRFSLSWSITVDGKRQRGAVPLSIWPEVEKALKLLGPNAGTLSIYVVEGVDTGPQKMQVFAENNHYVVALSVFDGEDYSTLAFHNADAPRDEEVMILGHGWSARQTTSDFDNVVEAFRTLFNESKVATHLLR